MAPKNNLFRQLQHLDESGSAERQAARQKRQEQSSGEILTTFLAYKLDHAADKMVRAEYYWGAELDDKPIGSFMHISAKLFRYQ